MSKKIVKCKICEKNITTRSKGKMFRHCGTDQLIEESLISDLSREKQPKKQAQGKVKSQDIPEKKEESQSKSKDVKNGKEARKHETTNEKPEKPERESEDEDDWGFG